MVVDLADETPTTLSAHINALCMHGYCKSVGTINSTVIHAPEIQQVQPLQITEITPLVEPSL